MLCWHIVASTVNGVPFAIHEPENGFFTNYGDIKAIEEKILLLIDNPELRKKMSENNMKKSKAYDWNDIYKRYMDEYENLLTENA